MEVLDTSIANVALPHIAGGLSAGQDESTWVLTSYLVSNAIVLPLSGWLSSIVGRKNFYMGCVALFTISSFLCGLAPNLAVLILCRVLQGAGGGGLQPSEQAILADTFPPAKRGMAFAVYGIAVVTAPAIGPTLGGWITDNFTWRWIFFINIPVGIISLLLTSRLIQDPPYSVAASSAKPKSTTSASASSPWVWELCRLCSTKASATTGSNRTSFSMLSLIAAVSLIFVIFWEWNHKDPIIDLASVPRSNLRHLESADVHAGIRPAGQHFTAALVHADFARIHRATSGLALMPGGFTIMLLLPLVGFLLSRYSPRWLLVFGLVMLSVLALSHDRLRSRKSISAPPPLLACFRPSEWHFCSYPSTPPLMPICRETKTTPLPA